MVVNPDERRTLRCRLYTLISLYTARCKQWNPCNPPIKWFWSLLLHLEREYAVSLPAELRVHTLLHGWDATFDMSANPFDVGWLMEDFWGASTLSRHPSTGHDDLPAPPVPVPVHGRGFLSLGCYDGRFMGLCYERGDPREANEGFIGLDGCLYIAADNDDTGSDSDDSDDGGTRRMAILMEPFLHASLRVYNRMVLK